MTLEEQTKRTSKFLSLVLRHEPEKIGITLDEQGWTNVDELLRALNRHGQAIDYETLEHVVDTNDKKRFAFSEDGESIRASQGHSVEVDLSYEPATPPEILYHGTVGRFLDGIRKDGIRKGQRHHVHLSTSTATASQVGQRRGSPLLLTIRAAEMHTAGQEFYVSANGVWLTDHVPANFINSPP